MNFNIYVCVVILYLEVATEPIKSGAPFFRMSSDIRPTSDLMLLVTVHEYGDSEW